MFKEKSYFREELPAYVLTASIKKYPIHFSDDLEVLYVLKGEIDLKCGYYDYTLKKGDVFVINPKETYSIDGSKSDNMVMMLKLDVSYFKMYHSGVENCFFELTNDKMSALPVLRNNMKKIMLEFLEKGYGHEHRIIENCHNLIFCLITDFKCKPFDDTSKDNKPRKILAQRLVRINKYIYENFKNKVTLNEIAEKENRSIYYLSHVIKEATGLSFQDFLSFIRVEESKKNLLGTNKKIGTISQEMGFSAVRYYIKHFKTWYKMEPEEYRMKGKDIELQKDINMYEKCHPEDIEIALNQQSYFDNHYHRTKNKPLIVELNLMEPELYDTEESEFNISDIMQDEFLKPLARPYFLMKSLNEKVIKSGYNYMITIGEKDGELVSLTVLIYNIDENIGGKLKKIETKEDIRELIETYEEDNEFLLKCSIPTGEFSVSRYKVSKNNIFMAYEENGKNSKVASKRDTLINSWSNLPDVEFNTIETSESLSIRTTLKGLSAELILIDKKE